MLGLESNERCRNTADVISIALDVGLPIYFTQLEQIFDSCEAYPVEELLAYRVPVVFIVLHEKRFPEMTIVMCTVKLSKKPEEEIKSIIERISSLFC